MTSNVLAMKHGVGQESSGSAVSVKQMIAIIVAVNKLKEAEKFGS